MPEEYVRKGDPYEKHCIETTRLLRAALGFDENEADADVPVALRPRQVARARDRRDRQGAGQARRQMLAVVTPGFSADCLETLEEIAVENAHIFSKHGGENFAALPCLNDSAPGMLLLEDWRCGS